MISNAPGTLADISDEQHRALAFSIWSIGPLNGPVTGPVIGGLVYQYLGWRWTNWIVLIFAGIAWVMSASIAETYAPVILKKKAAEMRKSQDDERYWCRYDERKELLDILKTNFSRPFILMATEPILWFWDIYISLNYGVRVFCIIKAWFLMRRLSEVLQRTIGGGLGFYSMLLATTNIISSHYMFTG